MATERASSPSGPSESSPKSVRPDDPAQGDEGTEQLLAQFQAGDPHALNRLWARYLPRLRKWAHARLPAQARPLGDTNDLIQDAFVRCLSHLATFVPRGPNTVYAYIKVSVRNQMRDTLRRVSRRSGGSELDPERHVDTAPSPLEQVVGRETLELYERALARLSEDDQDLIRAHVELGLTDPELAELLGKPSVAAARMARGRGLARLAREMRDLSDGTIAVQPGPLARSV